MMRAAIQALRLSNRNLSAGLVRLQSGGDAPAAIRFGDFLALRTDLLRAANCMRSISPDPALTAELEKEISEYRSNLEQIARVLPSVHGRLQAEKGRLETALDHLHAVAAWADASKDNL